MRVRLLRSPFFSVFYVTGSIVTESIVPVAFSFVLESNVARSIVGVHPSVLLRCLLLRGP